MLIASQPSVQPSVLRGPKLPQDNNQPPEPPRQSTMVERIVDKTYLGANYTASALSGTVGGLGAYAQSVVPATVKTTASFYKNFLKTETLGPNIKIIGSVLAAPVIAAGVVLGLPVSAIAGLYQGADEVDSSKPRQFTIGPAAAAGYKETREGWTSFTRNAVETFEEMGNEKLAEGEKPFDIPLIKTGKTVLAAAAGAAIGGAAGVVSAVLATAREAGVGIYRSFADESLHLGGKLLGSAAAVVGAPVHGAVYGATTALSITGRAIGQTWKNDAMFASIGQACVSGKDSVLAAVAPESTLLQEKSEDQ